MNKLKMHRLCTEMGRKAKNHDNIIRSKLKQKKHVNLDLNNLKIPEEIEYESIYI